MKTKITISFVIVFAFGLPLLKAADDLEIHSGNFTIDQDYNWVDVYNDAVVDMYEFSISQLDIYNTSRFDMYGGNIVSNNINVWNFGNLNIFDGTTSIIDSRGMSEVYIYGGINGSIFAWDDSTVILTGGDIGMLDAPGTNAYMHIYGYDFYFNEMTNILTGYWPDGTPLDIHLRRKQFYGDHYVLHEIPEPLSIILISMGALLTIRKVKIRNKK